MLGARAMWLRQAGQQPGVNVFVGPIKYSDIKTRHPVSVYSVDQICYLSVINKKEIYLLVNTVGDKGAFP